MKTINTKAFGTIEVDESQELYFSDGLFGFEKYKKFYLLENPDSPFVWLQSSEDESVAFIMIQPAQFKFDYELKISAEDYKSIDFDKNQDKLLDFVIVTVPPGNPEGMTANLQGPIIINVQKKLGRQAISSIETYSVKCKILDEMNKNKEGKKE